MFDLLVNDNATSFLTKDPLKWPTNTEYTEMQEKIHPMKVLNDYAKYGIALIQQINSSIPKKTKMYHFTFSDLSIYIKNNIPFLQNSTQLWT